jgi:hypothetical protein
MFIIYRRIKLHVPSIDIVVAVVVAVVVVEITNKMHRFAPLLYSICCDTTRPSTIFYRLHLN